MTRQEILSLAAKCVCRDRKDKHGNLEDNFKLIAGFWNLYLKYKKTHGISAIDVAVMMILLKVARICTGSGNIDNWVDIAGYAACGERLRK